MVLSTLLLAVSLAAAPAPAPRPRLQDEPIVDDRPELKGLFTTLQGHLSKKGVEDEQARTILDKLVQEFPQSGPKDRAAIVKEVAGCFDVKRPKELQEGVPDDRIFLSSAVALGTMGPESVKPLLEQLGGKDHKKNIRLQVEIAHSLGKTKSPDAVKPLLSLLKHKDSPMQAAGAESLGNYLEAPLDTRKVIFEELLKTLMDQMIKKQDITDTEAMDRWNVISGPIITTLQKVSGHNETDPELWQRWWNDNKKKEWGPKAE